MLEASNFNIGPVHLTAPPLTDPNIKQTTFNGSSKASPKGLGWGGSSFLLAFLKTNWSNIILEFRLSPGAFWEAWAKFAEVSVEAPRCLISFQARRAENPCRMPRECKRSTHVMRMFIHAHTSTYLYMHTYIYKAKNLNSCFECEIRPRYCTTRQDLSMRWLESFLHTSLTRKTRRLSFSAFLRFFVWGFYLFKYMHMHAPTIFAVLPSCCSCTSWKVL